MLCSTKNNKWKVCPSDTNEIDEDRISLGILGWTSVQINIQQLQNEQPLQKKRISLKMLGWILVQINIQQLLGKLSKKPNS